jgi:hypothetical protein
VTINYKYAFYIYQLWKRKDQPLHPQFDQFPSFVVAQEYISIYTSETREEELVIMGMVMILWKMEKKGSIEIQRHKDTLLL